MNETNVDSMWLGMLAQAAPPVAGSAGSTGGDAQPSMTQPGTPLGNGGGAPSGPGGFGLLLPMMLGLFVLMIMKIVIFVP